jgi:DNA invertase Pin-like site-specific DNA recombinase
MRLIAYMRVSSDGQVDAYGLDAQEHAIRQWCRRERHDLTSVVCDAGVSGATHAVDRPGFCELLERISAGEAEGLVLARLDRLARALTVQEATLAILWRAGHEVFTADSGRILADDPDDPMRTALRQVVGVFSELERKIVMKRLRDGRLAKAALGRKAVGAYAYGYEGVGKGRRRDAAPKAAEQAIVSQVLAARQAGMSYREIASLLDQAGVSPRRAKRWAPMTVRGIVLRSGGS